jgi:K+-sensing histidine kinase KdpD
MSAASIQSLKRTTPIALSLAIILAVTAVLSYFKDDNQYLIFFYLLPTAFVAIVYDSVLSMLCVITATLVSDFFLYDPIYSLYVSKTRDVGELIIFAGTGLIGAKCIGRQREGTPCTQNGLPGVLRRGAHGELYCDISKSAGRTDVAAREGMPRLRWRWRWRWPARD